LSVRAGTWVISTTLNL